jgi:signal peptidase II
LLVVVNSVVLIAIPAILAARSDFGRQQMIAVSLLLAGGIGNLLDRVFHNGLVIDFLNMGIGPLRTGIFNVADMAIMAGFALLLLQRSREPEPPPPEDFAAFGLNWLLRRGRKAEPAEVLKDEVGGMKSEG